MASSMLVGYTFGFSYLVGVNSKGEDIYRGQSFTNFKPSVTDAEVIGFADLVEELMYENYSISSMKKLLNYEVSRF